MASGANNPACLAAQGSADQSACRPQQNTASAASVVPAPFIAVRMDAPPWSPQAAGVRTCCRRVAQICCTFRPCFANCEL